MGDVLKSPTNRISILSFIAVVGGSAALLATTAQSQGGLVRNLVFLQGTTPGNSQSGHVHISGVMKAGAFAGNGALLTNLDAGNISVGSIPEIAIPASVVRTNVAQTIGAAKSFSATAAFENASMPFTVSSTARVDNLNAEYLNGLNSNSFLTQIPDPLLLSGNNTVAIIDATNSNTNFFTASAVRGIATGTTGGCSGGYFEASGTSAEAVYASANAITGQNYGVFGRTSSPDGYGVYGTGPEVGIYGSVTSGGVTTGVRGRVSSTEGRGVHGEATPSSGRCFGGFFESNSGVGVGVYGTITAPSGAAYGVHGEVTLSSGAGVFAQNHGTSSNSYGLLAESDAPNGKAIYGNATGSTSTNYGVYGISGAGAIGYGIYANGDMGASGTKSFRIDLPSDPENKYLLHYSSESPFPQNFYSGNVTTDAKGYAWVELPEYFADVNANFKYQLTVVDEGNDDDFVQVKVVKRIADNRFRIRASKANVVVSWRVEADRNDPYVRNATVRDIEPKTGHEVGTLQQPAAYGYAKERGIDFSPKREKSK